MKRSSSVENIATLLPNKKDSISFIADSSSDITPGAVMGGRPAATNLFPSDDLRTSSFSPFGDSLVYTEESTADVPYSNKRFNQLSSLSSQTTSSSALSGSLPSLHKLPAATGKTHEMTFSAPFGRHKPVMQPDFLDSMEISSCSSSIIMNRSKVGANPESESPEDMTLTPQHPNNQQCEPQTHPPGADHSCPNPLAP
uniref:Uncharacterized protein n=1 Tax=Ciona savignyi TaxID=51511 RepID=H2ZD44_CIOSA